MITREYVVKAWNGMGQRELGAYATRAEANVALERERTTARARGFWTLGMCERPNGSTWADRVLFTLAL